MCSYINHDFNICRTLKELIFRKDHVSSAHLGTMDKREPLKQSFEVIGSDCLAGIQQNYLLNEA